MSFKILSIIYAEFNLEKGPELVYQEPENYIELIKFTKISEFVVPTTQFCNKEIALHLGNAYLLGYPIFLNNSNYDRNRFEFNFCLLIDEEEYEKNNYLYDCLIKKINTTFENLEIDYNFNFMKNNIDMIKNFIKHLFLIFKKNQTVINIHIEEGELENDIIENEIETIENSDDDKNLIPLGKINYGKLTLSKSKTELPRLLPKHSLDLQYSHTSSKWIFKADLDNNYNINNNYKKANIKKQINFSFRYLDFTHIKINIQNYYVPIWIKELEKEEINKLDSINLRIINNINGINTVNKIAKNVSEGLDLVKYALSSLYIIRGITFIDILHDSNIYKPTTELKKLKIEGLYEKFKKFCKINKNESQYEINNNNNDENSLEYMDDNKLFSYYVLLANSKDVKSFRDKIKKIEFNMNLFIGFGVYLGIIRRIHIYFYYIGKGIIIDEIFSLMDGKHCEDEISVEKGISVEKLFEKYKDSEDKCYYLYK